MSQFLSDDWFTSATWTLNEHVGFTNAIKNVDLTIQFHVVEAPAGEVDYALKVGDGSAELTKGATEAPDVTVKNNYETATALAKGELNTQMAFMAGKLKVEGNMAKLMMNQAVINEFQQALAGMDTEF